MITHLCVNDTVYLVAPRFINVCVVFYNLLNRPGCQQFWGEIGQQQMPHLDFKGVCDFLNVIEGRRVGGINVWVQYIAYSPLRHTCPFRQFPL